MALSTGGGEDDRPSTVVRSKLQPPVRRAWVHRRRLVDLCVSPHRKLTLICAPAGWGKSTLLADWCATTESSHRFAWLTLDPFDNDPVRLWTHLIEALRTIDGSLGEQPLSLLTAPRIDIAAHVVPAILNDLTDRSEDIVVVLDDYHVVTHDETHTALGYLIDHLPPNVQVAMTSRARPPLPLARLRGRGQLVEIGMLQLAFRSDEVLDLLKGVHDLDIDHDAVGHLTHATEGWAAALHLSALTLRTTPSVDALVSEVQIGNRHIDDYLASEVLDGLDPETRTFLMETSILDQLCAELCDEVTGRDDAERMLAALEAGNLFVIPLDERRTWYRYHHVFADYLRGRWVDEHAELVPALHRRAAAWYWRHGRTDEAVAHTVAAGDADAAADLIVDRWHDARATARLEALLAWIDRLPQEAAARDPRLGLIRASSLQELGRIDESDRWLDLTDDLVDGATPELERSELACGIRASRTVNSYYRGDVDAILARAGTGPEAPDRSDYWDSVLFTTIGAARFLRGETQEATRMLDAAVAAGGRTGHTLALIHSLGWLAIAVMEQNQLIRARGVLGQAERLLAGHPGLHAYYGAAMLVLARGQMLEVDGEARLADEQLGEAMQLATQGSAMLELAYAATTRARVAHRLGDHASAATHLAHARDAASTCRGCRVLSNRIEAVARLLSGRPDDPFYVEPLSEREREVLRLLPSNLSQREIADALNVSFNTVKTHSRNIFRKLAAETRADAVKRARDLGLL